jgi:hypothetical protein
MLGKSVLQSPHTDAPASFFRNAAEAQSAAFLFVIIQSSNALSKSLKSGLM